MDGNALLKPIEPAGAAGPALAETPSSPAGEPSPEFLALITHDFARRHLILSAGCDGGVERLIVAEQTRPAPIFNVGVRLGRPVQSAVGPAEEIAAAIDQVY